MEIAARNRLLKKVLEQKFGRGSIRVRGSRGTGYDWWVSVYITTPNDGRQYFDRSREVFELLQKNNVCFGTYGYDDRGSDYGHGSMIDIQFEEPQQPKQWSGETARLRVGGPYGS